MAFEPATKARKDEALREAREGVALDPMDEFNLLNLAIPLMDFSGDVPEAMVLLHRILEVNPNFSLAYGLLGDTYLALGQADEAIRNAEICIRLNPRDPLNFYRYETLAKASLQNNDTERALHWANRIAALKPDYWAGYAFSAAILAGRGDLERARRSVDALRYCWPSVSISAIKAMEPYSVAPWRLSYLQNLVDAGISE